MADFKKGGNAFGIAAGFIVMGGVLWAIGYALGRLPESWVLGTLFSHELLGFGKISLVFGVLGLLVATPGAFLTLDTHGSSTGVITVAIMIASATVFYVFITIPLGLRLYEAPWLQVFFGLLSLIGLLLLSSFFLYAARLPDKQPDTFARVLESAVISGKVSMFRSRNIH